MRGSAFPVLLGGYALAAAAGGALGAAGAGWIAAAAVFWLGGAALSAGLAAARAALAPAEAREPEIDHAAELARWERERRGPEAGDATSETSRGAGGSAAL